MSYDAFEKERTQFQKKFDAKPSDLTLYLLDVAKEEADKLGHDHTGTEHILIGASLTPGSGEALHALGVNARNLRSATELIIGSIHRSQRTGNRGFTPRAEGAINFSVAESRRLSLEEVEPEHVVLGVLQYDNGLAASVLESLGSSSRVVRDRFQQLHQPRS